MDRPAQEVHETTTRMGNTTQTTQEVFEPQRTRSRGQIIAARIVWYLAGILLALLAIRFVLALLGANPANSFANFIYNVTSPFVRPFVTLFGYSIRYGVARVEPFTIIAMIIYFLVALGITKLITITRD